jgi:hypothetical protein
MLGDIKEFFRGSSEYAKGISLRGMELQESEWKELMLNWEPWCTHGRRMIQASLFQSHETVSMRSLSDLNRGHLSECEGVPAGWLAIRKLDRFQEGGQVPN